MADQFDSVVLIALNGTADEELALVLPDNVKVVALCGKHGRGGRLSFLLQSIVMKPEASEIKNSIYEDDQPSTLVEKLLTRYYAAKVCDAWNRLADMEDVIDEVENASFSLIESYRFFDGAGVAAMFKSHIAGNGHAIARTHRYDLYSEMNRFCYLPARNWLLKRLDRVYSCSQDGLRYLQQRHPDYCDRIKVAYLGTLDHGVNKSTKSMRGSIRLLSCSRCAPEKRLDRMVEAIKIACKYVEVYWTHVGGGADLEKIKRLASVSGVNGRFLGSKPHPETIKEYRDGKYDAFINVSDSEGIPLAIMEALSFGLPVIATDVGGTAEAVEDGNNGILISNDPSPERVAECILRFANCEADDKMRFSANARKSWENRFDGVSNSMAVICSSVNDHARL